MAFQRLIPLASLIITIAVLSAGCEERDKERFGKTFYLDGAGNWGYGAADVPAGLMDAGYRGDVELFIWTMSFNPLVDQLNILGAKARASALTEKIKSYARAFPNNPINVIALSAGTGVATWAIEGLPSDVRIENLVLLGSSLSHDYDMSRALSHMDGRIYVYYSNLDTVLETVRVVGTIDGKRGVDSIGYVGLRPPRGAQDRVVNIGWNRSWMRLGWTGAHTDTTNRLFVSQEISKHIKAARPAPSITDDNRPVTASLDTGQQLSNL